MRRIKRRSAEKSIAVIIDGKDEKWYLETIKEHYPNMAMKKATIKPDLPQKKSVENRADALLFSFIISDIP